MRKIIMLILVISTLLSASVTYSALDLEMYGKLEQVSDVSISPNGELIAYRRTESDNDDYIVVFSIKENKMIALLDVKKIDPQGHYFADNNFIILIGSNHVNLQGYKHEFDASLAFSFDVTKNKVEPLIKFGELILNRRQMITRGQTGLGKVVGKSIDGKKLYMPSFISDSELDPTPNYSLLEVNIDGKGKPKIVSNGTRDTRDYFLDDRGNILARENLNDRSNEHSIDVFKKGRWRTIYSYKSKIATHSFVGLNSDFTAIVFFRNDDEEDYLELSLEDGSIKPLEELQISRDTSGFIKSQHGAVLGVRYAGFTPDYQLSDKALNKRVNEILSYFDSQSVYLTDWTHDWQHIVVRVEGSSYGGEYFLFSEGEDPKFLTRSRLELDPKDINPLATTKYKARDGLSIPMLLTLPKEHASNIKNLPAVLMPHGGPAAQDQIDFNYMAQALASRGYLVIQPQFRGSTGFGSEHYEAGWGEWGKKMQDDLTDSIKALASKQYIDTNRLCIVGASYGGYAALAGAAFTPDLFKCAVSIAGVSHLPDMLLADKSRYGKKSWVLDYWNRSILASDYDKDSLKAVSPYYSADKIKIPVLLLHGEDDTVVEYKQSKLMYKAIKKVKGDVRLVKLKNDDHYLRDGATRIQAVKEMVQFVNKHIGQ